MNNKPHSKETKAKMSELAKARSTSFKKGYVPWNKGMKCSWVTKTKKGIPLKEETKKKLSKTMKGRTSPRLGVKLSLEQRQNFSMAQTKEKFFNGFKSTKNHQLRTSEKWVSWRKQVYERDDYTCQQCDVKGIELHPHHIIRVKDCIKDDNLNLVYDVNNGVTLCKPCHQLKHKK